ncbi:MAG TPA: GNAT family N-acetyltransferase [Pyrinomonadaceae bacterium]|nr:GNAT family N-acetyltransferase [Pyrinomonadaceae bacterium]
MSVQIRRARPDEAPTLTAIAFAAKRHWNYPEKWIQLWTTELTITPEFIADHEVFVALIDRRIVGCCALVVSDSHGELEHMWIDPPQMGSGVGRALFEHVKERAKQLGLIELDLSADPNAEGFYERMGAKRIGEVRSEIDGQPRVLPRMRITLEPEP